MSRLMFRDVAGDVAWQKQIRDHYVSEGVPPVPHLSVKRAIVRPVSRKVAKQIILKYEWLGTMAQTGIHYGIFFGLFCAGVTCIAAGGGTGGVNAHREFGIKSGELATLARGACVHWAPGGTNSKLVSWTCRLLPKDTSAKLVLAYSDTDAGEIGTIYQACNWVCIGRGASVAQFVAPNGRIYDQKIVYDIRRKKGTIGRVSWTDQRDALLDAGWKQQMSNPKWRYVYVLDRSDKRLVDLVESKRVPYPKRETCAGSVDGNAPTNQAGDGGSTPTPALNEQGGALKRAGA